MLREITTADITRINELLETIRLHAKKINEAQGEIRDIIATIRLSKPL